MEKQSRQSLLWELESGICKERRLIQTIDSMGDLANELAIGDSFISIRKHPEIIKELRAHFIRERDEINSANETLAEKLYGLH